jgi:hypothetical protein
MDYRDRISCTGFPETSCGVLAFYAPNPEYFDPKNIVKLASKSEEVLGIRIVSSPCR